MTLKHKAIISALMSLRDQPKKAKSFLNDKRMTSQEKIILASFLALRDFENQNVIDTLAKIKCSDQFVESQRHFCLGIAFNNLTQYPEAKFHLSESFELNQFEDGIEFKISVCQSLFTVNLNTHRIDGMEETIQKMRKITSASQNLALAIQYCEFSLVIQKQESGQAKKLIPKMEQIFSLLNEHQTISYLYDLFDLHLIEDNFEQCSEALDRIKRYKKFKNSTHVKYMQSMIGFIKDDAPIYLYEQNFQMYPMLLNQVLCIKALETGDEAAALQAWSKLHKIAPESFRVPFEFHGSPTLFSKALNKFKLQVKPISVPISFQENLTKEEKLIHLLDNSPIPLQKETIYQLLWEKELDSKDDLKKLVKVVQRAREKFAVDIKSIKGAYSLKQDKAG